MSDHPSLERAPLYRFDIQFDNLLFQTTIGEPVHQDTSSFMFLPHNHSNYELHYVVDGQVYIHTPALDYTASSNDVCIVHPYEYHTFLKPAENTPAHLACISFYLEEKNTGQKGTIDFTRIRENLDRTYTFHDPTGTLGILFERLHNEFERKRPGYLASVQALLTAFLVCLVQDLSSQSPTPKNVAPIVYDSDRECIIERFFMYNYMKSPTIDELSEQLHLCPRRVSQLIKQLYGCTFSQKLMDTRVEVAKLLLLYTRHSVTAISTMCGFNSLNYFFKSFRKATQRSPKEYREASTIPFASKIKYE